ncbi:reverse transcriptase-like protein [Candidatus Saccharibacteria bacterium]|nr:reverse transcriptase-like protein [Candidatus Saccharibacteria bacterium]
MKQKVSVYAIIKHNGKVLLLRRALGRSDIIGKYELPGGELPYGLSPQQAMTKFITEQTGADPQTLQLYDVRAYPSVYDDRTQRVDIVFLVSIHSPPGIELSGRHSKYAWRAMHEIHQSDVTEATYNLLGLDKTPEFLLSLGLTAAPQLNKNAADILVIAYADGGSRGNPGPSASGFVLYDEHGHLLQDGGEYLGITTNNRAEYEAVRLALETAIKRGVHRIQFRLDSQLVVNQMNGTFKVKNSELKPIHDHVTSLIKQFEHVTFGHIRREFNHEADAIVNRILDEHAAAIAEDDIMADVR